MVLNSRDGIQMTKPNCVDPIQNDSYRPLFGTEWNIRSQIQTSQYTQSSNQLKSHFWNSHFRGFKIFQVSCITFISFSEAKGTKNTFWSILSSEKGTRIRYM